ncbi:MAG: ATP-binding cassette domain-containing protein [Lachnospiraceae bacterium]|nr:ATP-binding cassette domain-containing protein [Lachnospiraceae bacterium]
MALYVDIEKSFRGFQLKSRFEAKDEVLAMLGASGCGKSVTLKCIAGIVTPDRGKIVLDGKVLFDSEEKINVPTKNRDIGYLFQNYALFPNMTVAENIKCGIKKAVKGKEEIVELMERFCVLDCQEKYPHQLSGGQQQRVALARMVASKPKLIMLDEPFSALDDYLKWTLEQEIMEVIDKFEGTTLFVSHNRNEVYQLSDRIAVMSEGQIEVLEHKKELFENPKTLAGTLLTGCKNISTAIKIDANHLLASDWNLTIKVKREIPDDIQYVGFRAHYFKQTTQMKNTNVIKCSICKAIESTFSMIILFYNEGSDKTIPYAKLRYEIAKEQWEQLDQNNLYLEMPEDKLILMS